MHPVSKHPKPDTRAKTQERRTFMGHVQVAAHSEPVFDARKHLEKVARLVAHQDVFCTTSRLERERKVFLCRTKRERRGGKGQFNRTGVESDAAHPSRIGGGDLWWVCEHDDETVRGVEHTGDLFKVAFVKEGRVGDRTCDDRPLCGQIEHERCAEAVAWQVDVCSASEARFDRGYETRTDCGVLCRLGACTDDEEHQIEEGWCGFSPYVALTASSHFGKTSRALTSASSAHAALSRSAGKSWMGSPKK